MRLGSTRSIFAAGCWGSCLRRSPHRGHHYFGAFCGTCVGFRRMRFRVRQQKHALEVDLSCANKRPWGAPARPVYLEGPLWSLNTSIYVRGLALQFYVVCWWWLAAVGFWRWWHALCKARTSSPMEVSVELWVQCRGCAAFSP